MLKVNKFVNLIFMTWTVSFYNEKVERQTLKFPKSILANFLHIVGMIETFGPNLGKPQKAPKKELDLARKRLKELKQ